MTSSGRIEKKILLQAPRTRVWRALTNAEEFGTWFGVKFEGTFAVGKSLTGNMTIKGYEHMTMEVTVEHMHAEDHFSYRWHPFAVDPKFDYSVEPTTLVEFRLEVSGEGTMLTVAETGFDKIPAGRRDEAFRMNERGWTSQIENIKRYVAS